MVRLQRPIVLRGHVKDRARFLTSMFYQVSHFHAGSPKAGAQDLLGLRHVRRTAVSGGVPDGQRHQAVTSGPQPTQPHVHALGCPDPVPYLIHQRLIAEVKIDPQVTEQGQMGDEGLRQLLDEVLCARPPIVETVLAKEDCQSLSPNELAGPEERRDAVSRVVERDRGILDYCPSENHDPYLGW